MWSLYGLPMSGRFSPASPVPSPVPKMCTFGELVCLHWSSVSVSVYECALRGKGVLPRGCPAFCLKLLGEVPITLNSKLESVGGNRMSLFICINFS